MRTHVSRSVTGKLVLLSCLGKVQSINLEHILWHGEIGLTRWSHLLTSSKPLTLSTSEKRENIMHASMVVKTCLIFYHDDSDACQTWLLEIYFSRSVRKKSSRTDWVITTLVESNLLMCDVVMEAALLILWVSTERTYNTPHLNNIMTWHTGQLQQT